nr:MAG TPA: hypothetical protein [Caudoviricetes sp.]
MHIFSEIQLMYLHLYSIKQHLLNLLSFFPFYHFLSICFFRGAI